MARVRAFCVFYFAVVLGIRSWRGNARHARGRFWSDTPAGCRPIVLLWGRVSVALQSATPRTGAMAGINSPNKHRKREQGRGGFYAGWTRVGGAGWWGARRRARPVLERSRLEVHVHVVPRDLEDAGVEGAELLKKRRAHVCVRARVSNAPCLSAPEERSARGAVAEWTCAHRCRNCRSPGTRRAPCRMKRHWLN